MFHERTKHSKIDCHFVRVKIQDGTMTHIHIGIKNQIADIMTKALSKQQHHIVLKSFGILDLFCRCKQPNEEEDRN